MESIEELKAELAPIEHERDHLQEENNRLKGAQLFKGRNDVYPLLKDSWKGTLQQYAGRLHRLHENKKQVIIYDYVDRKVPMLMRMYKKRQEGYRAMGYSITDKEQYGEG